MRALTYRGVVPALAMALSLGAGWLVCGCSGESNPTASDADGSVGDSSLDSSSDDHTGGDLPDLQPSDLRIDLDVQQDLGSDLEADEEVVQPPPPLYWTDGKNIRNQEGQAILFRGVAVASGDLANWADETPGADEAVFDHIASSGFNAVRLAINWDRIEPQPDQYDQQYLDLVEKHVRMAAERKLYVVVDMHQDMYGVGFGLHGAPDWSCDASNYETFEPVETWFLNYFSEEVSACFDHFWKDHATHEHQQKAAAELAKRLVDVEYLMGFDPINEPFPGTTQFVPFDTDYLMPFYQEFAQVVGAVLPGRLYFIEPAVTFSAGYTSALPGPVTDFQAVFAPHYYNTSVEMDKNWDGDPVAVANAVAGASTVAETLATPWIYGEMGGAMETANLADYLLELFGLLDQHLAGSVMWIYSKGETGFGLIYKPTGDWNAHAKAYLRPSASLWGGVPVSHSWNYASLSLDMAWTQEEGLVTEVILPAWVKQVGYTCLLDSVAWEPVLNAQGNRLVIPAGSAGPRQFSMQVHSRYPADFYQGMEPTGVPLGEFLGIASHLPSDLGENFERDFELDKMQESGTKHFRKTFRWEEMEPADDTYYFDEYNLVIDQVRAHGMDVMVGFRGKPGWGSSDGTHDGLDTAKWSEFLGVFADEVKERVQLYEIWNEPNLNVFWDPEPNPTKYGELLMAAHTAIHEHDDDAVVLLGGLSPFQFNDLGVWGFMEEVFLAYPNLCDHFDALAIHPYTFLQMLPPEQGATMMGVYQPGMVGMIQYARDLMAEYGCGDKPIYLTEAGWPDYYLGLETQAAYLARGIPLALSAGAKVWYNYTFWDGEITADTDIPSEERFGFFTWPNDETTQAKPQYEVYKVFGNQLAGYRYAGDLGARLEFDPTVRALVLRDDQGHWLVGMWHEVGEDHLLETVTVYVPFHPEATGQWELLDQTLTPLQAGEVSQTPLMVALTGQVQWLKFSVAPTPAPTPASAK